MSLKTDRNFLDNHHRTLIALGKGWLLTGILLLLNACTTGQQTLSTVSIPASTQTKDTVSKLDEVPTPQPEVVPDFPIIYSANNQVYRYFFDSTEPLAYEQAEGFLSNSSSAKYLTISPDGSMLLFDGYDPQIGCPTFRATKKCWLTGPNGFFTLNLTNGAAELVAPFAITNIDWSPDGSRIVYAQLIFDTPLYQSRLMVKPIDGGESSPITDGNWVDEYPSWSPDGEWIAFLRFAPPAAGAPECTPAPGFYDECYDPSLYIVHPDGSGLTRLLRHVRMVQTPYNQPSWSPDSKTIAVIAGKDPAEITLVDIETKKSTVLPGFVPSADTPVWSPDGRMLAFTSQMNASEQVILITREGEFIKVISPEGEAGSAPSWSPDGKWLAWIGGHSNGLQHLYAASIGGETLISLDTIPADSRPVWLNGE